MINRTTARQLDVISSKSKNKYDISLSPDGMYELKSFVKNSDDRGTVLFCSSEETRIADCVSIIFKYVNNEISSFREDRF